MGAAGPIFTVPIRLRFGMSEIEKVSVYIFTTIQAFASRAAFMDHRFCAKLVAR